MILKISTAAVLVAAIACHGAGHWFAGRCVGVRMRRLALTPTGIRMVVDEGDFPSYFAEIICALGGPLGNLLGGVVGGVLVVGLAPMFRPICHDFVAVSVYLALLNLLPLRHFDGGRVLYCLLCLGGQKSVCSPDRADRILEWTSMCFLFALWLLSVYLLLRTGQSVSLYLFCLQLFRAVTEKDMQK